jgi:hypothetical protein
VRFRVAEFTRRARKQNDLAEAGQGTPLPASSPLAGAAFPRVAAGFGVPFAKHWSVGGEAGWLFNGAQLLLRLSYTF